MIYCYETVQKGTGNDRSDNQSVITTFLGYRDYADDVVYFTGAKVYTWLDMYVKIFSIDLSCKLVLILDCLIWILFMFTNPVPWHFPPKNLELEMGWLFRNYYRIRNSKNETGFIFQKVHNSKNDIEPCLVYGITNLLNIEHHFISTIMNLV